LTGGTGKPFPDSDGRSKKPVLWLATSVSGFAPVLRTQVRALVLKFQAMATSCRKHFTINSEYFMKNVFCFEGFSTAILATALSGGLTAYGVNTPKVGPPATLWLRLSDGRTLRVGVNMHDLADWEEIGTLTFEIVEPKDAPELIDLAASWLDVQDVHKLVYLSEECEAESGFSLSTTCGETLTVLPGADVYTLAIEAPFYLKPFNPENDVPVYARKKM
jgi:hypothetical protein